MLKRKKLLASCHLVLMPSLQEPKVFDTNGRDSSFSSVRLHKNGNMTLLAHILALGQRSAQKRWAINILIQENVVTPDYVNKSTRLRLNFPMDASPLSPFVPPIAFFLRRSITKYGDSLI
jgi:hypothetical protein